MTQTRYTQETRRNIKSKNEGFFASGIWKVNVCVLKSAKMKMSFFLMKAEILRASRGELLICF